MGIYWFLAAVYFIYLFFSTKMYLSQDEYLENVGIEIDKFQTEYDIEIDFGVITTDALYITMMTVTMLQVILFPLSIMTSVYLKLKYKK